MRHVRAIAALAGVVLALAACGGSDDGGSAKSDPFQGKTAQQVLDQSIAAAKAAKSVHLKGSSKEEGSEFELDLVLSSDQGAKGSISAAGQKVDLLQVGEDIYVKGGPTAQLGEKFKDKWLKSKAGQGGAQDFSELTSMDAFFSNALKPDGKITLVAGKEVDGKQTVGLQDDKTGSDKGVLYISKEGPAYPLLITGGNDPGGLQFTEWNAPVSVEAPAAAQVVDEKELAKELGKG